MDDVIWKHFEFGEIEEALAHAKAGGIALHETGIPYRGHRTCHMFAKDETALREAARELRLRTGWYQPHRDRGGVFASEFGHHFTGHYDLFGGPLRKALAKCDGA